MAKVNKILKLFCGILIGVGFSRFFMTSFDQRANMACDKTGILESAQLKSEKNTNLLFVGVMTASQYLDSRAKAVYNTWGKEVPGKVVFYSSEGSRSTSIPLVALRGVDDSYPPQKKSFMMLKHMYDHYLDQYEWFMRADDDVYVRPDRLEKLLRSVDSNKVWFIGQTGRGNNDEFGLLSLDSDENFCMGGPGVIMSRATLKRVAPHVDTCLRHLYTTHEDVELGRCVRKFAGASCTWSYEMQVILYHNQSGQMAFTGDLKQKEVHRAITLHPIKHPDHMERLHKYVKGLKIQNKQDEVIDLHRDITVSMAELGFSKKNLDKANLVENLPLFPYKKGIPCYLGDTNILGTQSSLNRYSPKDLQNVLEWEFISKTLYSHKDLNPKRRIGSSLKEGLADIVREVMELINSYSKQRGRIIDFKEILYGYWRLDPIHGVDIILDLLLVYRKYRGHKMTVQVRRHAYVQQSFTDIYIREINSPIAPKIDVMPVHKQLVQKLISLKKNIEPYFSLSPKKDETRIHLILPLSGRFDTFKRFLTMYEEICVKNEESVTLHIILYKPYAGEENFEKSLQILQNVINKGYATVKIVENEEFARGKALQYGVNDLLESDLMLFIDVDIVFNYKSLERIRQNTRRNASIYFPIVYSTYNPKMLNKTMLEEYFEYNLNYINENNGFWRQFGFGIVSLYKSDYLSLGGFNLLLSGWGFEDVTFYDNAVKSNIKIVRTVDPGLFHVYHDVFCDSDLDSAQKNMCIGTKASTLGSLQTLQKYFKYYKYFFS